MLLMYVKQGWYKDSWPGLDTILTRYMKSPTTVCAYEARKEVKAPKIGAHSELLNSAIDTRP